MPSSGMLPGKGACQAVQDRPALRLRGTPAPRKYSTSAVEFVQSMPFNRPISPAESTIDHEVKAPWWGSRLRRRLMAISTACNLLAAAATRAVTPWKRRGGSSTRARSDLVRASARASSCRRTSRGYPGEDVPSPSALAVAKRPAAAAALVMLNGAISPRVVDSRGDVRARGENRGVNEALDVGMLGRVSIRLSAANSMISLFQLGFGAAQARHEKMIRPLPGAVPPSWYCWLLFAATRSSTTESSAGVIPTSSTIRPRSASAG